MFIFRKPYVLLLSTGFMLSWFVGCSKEDDNGSEIMVVEGVLDAKYANWSDVSVTFVRDGIDLSIDDWVVVGSVSD